ncbi:MULTISPECIES: cyclase family protein [Streptomyces]|nr:MULTISPECIES: cyclase family protein [Streptomyces]
MCNPALIGSLKVPAAAYAHAFAHLRPSAAAGAAAPHEPAPAHAQVHEHAHAPAHAEVGAPAQARPASAEAGAARHGNDEPPHRGSGRRGVGRRALFRFGTAGAATVAAGAALGGVAQAAAPAAEARGIRLPHAPRIADLTHELGEDFPVFYPLVAQPEFEQNRFIGVDGFNANQLNINEHAGTHIDVPGHFEDGAPTVEQILPESLVVPLAVVRIAERAARDPETLLTVRDILRWESRHGRLPARAFVAVDSGWGERVHTPGAHLNEGADGVFRFPGISPEAAAFLVEEREITGAGVDTSSLDGGVAPVPLTHQTLLPAGRYGIENLTGLDAAPDRDALLVVGAPKHRGGYGGQIRALALY